MIQGSKQHLPAVAAATATTAVVMRDFCVGFFPSLESRVIILVSNTEFLNDIWLHSYLAIWKHSIVDDTCLIFVDRTELKCSFQNKYIW